MKEQPPKLICEICGGAHPTAKHQALAGAKPLQEKKSLPQPTAVDEQTATLEKYKLDLDVLSYVTTSPININGIPGDRLMVVYKTIGCAYDKGGKGCEMCDFSFYANPNVKDENIMRQHQKVLEMLDKKKFDQLDLLTLGNFYHDKEISPAVRKYLLTTVARTEVKRVLTESRRGYITTEKLKIARSYLRDDQTLEYGLGYETLKEDIRNRILKKGVPERHLNEALEICKETGVDFVAYVLIKPHTLSEKEAIDEAVDTTIHVLKKSQDKGVNGRVALEPVFVTRGKNLEKAFLRGEYTPPKLWSVVQVLINISKRLGQDQLGGKIFVGLSDENLSSERTTKNCGLCDAEIISAIQTFNGTQNIEPLKHLDCECKKEWLNSISNQ